MAAKGSVSKQKDLNARHRVLNGEVVKPVLYNGFNAGHGKYFAAEVKGQLMMDETGKPLPFRSVGELVRVHQI